MSIAGLLKHATVALCLFGTNAFLPTTRVAFSKSPDSSVQHREHTLKYNSNQRFPNGIHSQSKSFILKKLHLAVPGAPAEMARLIFDYKGNVPFSLALGVNAVLFSAAKSKLFTMLTPTGFAHAMALGTLLWTTLGWRGWTYCVLYLLLGNLVTKVKFAEKSKRGLAEGRGGRRGPENVWGSAATGLTCAICSVQGDFFLGISSKVFVLGYVASIATKLADTFASEIGKAYGKTTFLITTMARVEPGTEGAVSAEGTAAAALGGFMLSLYGYGIGLIDGRSVAISTVAAFIATNVESLLGATLQGKKGFGWITNEVINFFNTLIGAGIAMATGILALGM